MGLTSSWLADAMIPKASEASKKTLNSPFSILQWGAELFFVWPSLGFIRPFFGTLSLGFIRPFFGTFPFATQLNLGFSSISAFSEPLGIAKTCIRPFKQKLAAGSRSPNHRRCTRIFLYCLAWADDSCCLTLPRGGEINGCARPSAGNLVELILFQWAFVESIPYRRMFQLPSRR